MNTYSSYKKDKTFLLKEVLKDAMRFLTPIQTLAVYILFGTTFLRATTMESNYLREFYRKCVQAKGIHELIQKFIYVEGAISLNALKEDFNKI